MFWSSRIYADAAGGLPPHYNPGALHREGVAAKKELEKARASVATSIGAHADEIIFVANATDANAFAATLATAHTITSAIEHQSMLEPLRAAGVEVTELPVDAEGLLFPSAVSSALTPNTTFASIQLVNSEVGSIQPIRAISKELKRAKQKVYFHTDAAQAPLWVDINVEQLGVDLMTLDGVLYIKRGTPLALPRQGTPNVAEARAVAAFLAQAQKKAEKRAKKTAAVRDYCWAEIKNRIPDAILNGPCLQGEALPSDVKASPCRRVANNLNVSVPGLDAQMAVVSLDALGVAASTRSACDMGSNEPSHVIRALGVPKELAGTAIRLTFLPDFTARQARRIAEALKETADRYRRA